MAKNDLLEEAKRRYKLATDTNEEQLRREVEDLRFQIPEEQWDEDARRQRQGETDGTPERPILSISKIDQPIQLVLNQEKAAKLGVHVSPLSPDAGREQAVVREGIYRRIERDSKAHQARSWGFDRGVKAGRGSWRVNTEWDDTSENPTDQRITIERILHQDHVVWDPAATKADFSDAEYCFVGTWMPVDTFERTFPEAKTQPNEGTEWADLVESEPEWVRGEGESKALLVCEYFYKQHTKEKAGKRQRDVVKVHVAKFSGFDVLTDEETDGQYIPIVTVVGRELQPVDGKRRWIGVIHNAKDAQRMYNYSASQAVEIAALEPKVPWIGAEGQFEGHEDEWGESNFKNYPYLEYKPTTVGEQMAPPPSRAQIDVSRLGPSMQLLQQADQFLQATTFTFDPSLGRISDRDKSGRAILALQQQGEAGTSHYMQNLTEAMLYEATVILDLIPHIYDRQGRIVQVLDDEGETETVMLNQRFYSDPETKQPVPLGPEQGPPSMPAPNMPPPMPGQPPQEAPPPPPPPKVREIDLSKGRYSVAVSVEKKRQTAMKEGAEQLGTLLESRPELMPILGPLYLEYNQWPGSQKAKEILEKVRDSQYPMLKDDEQPDPQQLQGQIQQMGQQLEMAQQQIGQLNQVLLADREKNQAMLEKARMDNEAKVAIANQNNQTKLMMEKLDKVLSGQKLEHTSVEKDLDRDHDEEMAVLDAELKTEGI